MPKSSFVSLVNLSEFSALRGVRQLCCRFLNCAIAVLEDVSQAAAPNRIALCYNSEVCARRKTN